MIKGLLVTGLIGLIGVWTASTAINLEHTNLSTESSSLSHKLTVSSPTTKVSTASSTPSSSQSSSSNSSATLGGATSNWAGYVATGSTYTGISGSWTVPSVSSSDDETSADASWIGIGGVSTEDLIQVGTQNIVEDGQVSTGSFYEELPNSSETISSINVNPGDTIAASIKESDGGVWDITMTDVTNGESYSNTVYYDSSESSAEWIEEAPSDGASDIIPLDQFGSVSFTNGSVTADNTTESIEASGAKAVTMEDNEGQQLTSVSSLSDNGSGFSVARSSADSEDTNDYTNNDSGFGSYGENNGYWPGGAGMGMGSGFGHRLFRMSE